MVGHGQTYEGVGTPSGMSSRPKGIEFRPTGVAGRQTGIAGCTKEASRAVLGARRADIQYLSALFHLHLPSPLFQAKIHFKFIQMASKPVSRVQLQTISSLVGYIGPTTSLHAA